MNINDQMGGIWAVVLAVKDLDAACSKYEALGFKLLVREHRVAWGIEAAKFDNGGNSIIEILSPRKPGNGVSDAVQKFLGRNVAGHSWRLARFTASLHFECSPLNQCAASSRFQPYRDRFFIRFGGMIF